MSASKGKSCWCIPAVVFIAFFFVSTFISLPSSSRLLRTIAFPLSSLASPLVAQRSRGQCAGVHFSHWAGNRQQSYADRLTLAEQGLFSCSVIGTCTALCFLHLLFLVILVSEPCQALVCSFHWSFLQICCAKLYFMCNCSDFTTPAFYCAFLQYRESHIIEVLVLYLCHPHHQPLACPVRSTCVLQNLCCCQLQSLCNL